MEGIMEVRQECRIEGRKEWMMEVRKECVNKGRLFCIYTYMIICTYIRVSCVLSCLAQARLRINACGASRQVA